MNLKRGLVAVSLFAVSLPVVAADIDKIQALSQDDFHKLSQDLGAALSYKPLTPTAPLGITGFDLGLAVTATSIKNSDVLQKAGAGDHSTLRRRSASAAVTPSSPAWISSTSIPRALTFRS